MERLTMVLFGFSVFFFVVSFVMFVVVSVRERKNGHQIKRLKEKVGLDIDYDYSFTHEAKIEKLKESVSDMADRTRNTFTLFAKFLGVELTEMPSQKKLVKIKKR
jgi:hypothetical protein